MFLLNANVFMTKSSRLPEELNWRHRSEMFTPGRQLTAVWYQMFDESPHSSQFGCLCKFTMSRNIARYLQTVNIQQVAHVKLQTPSTLFPSLYCYFYFYFTFLVPRGKQYYSFHRESSIVQVVFFKFFPRIS